MNNTRPAPMFGISIDPSAAGRHQSFRQARLADEHDLDLVALMDHPYNGKLLDTWTLLTALAVNTERVHLATNVLNLPLRPPAMLAKMAASLDVLSDGRVELGIGAGAFWDGVASFGGPRRSPGEAYQAFKDELHILKGMWANAGGTYTYEGEFYQVTQAQAGPAPAHPIRIWTGALGPKMLNLTGQMADGVLVSYNYVPPEKLANLHQRIDAGAEEAGRKPNEIRRGYNLMGVLDTGQPDTRIRGVGAEFLNGTTQEWIEQLIGLYENYRMDTFIFWPIAGNGPAQIEAFAKEVTPAVKDALS